MMKRRAFLTLLPAGFTIVGSPAYAQNAPELLAGDVKALAERFQAEGALQGAQGWRLALKPRDANLAGFITRIELEGSRHVDSVNLHEASGDASRIRFFNHAASSLSPAEAGRFGP